MLLTVPLGPLVNVVTGATLSGMRSVLLVGATSLLNRNKSVHIVLFVLVRMRGIVARMQPAASDRGRTEEELKDATLTRCRGQH